MMKMMGLREIMISINQNKEVASTANQFLIFTQARKTMRSTKPDHHLVHPKRKEERQLMNYKDFSLTTLVHGKQMLKAKVAL